MTRGEGPDLPSNDTSSAPSAGRRFWINTVSLDHVEGAIEGGFTQADHPCTRIDNGNRTAAGSLEVRRRDRQSRQLADLDALAAAAARPYDAASPVRCVLLTGGPVNLCTGGDVRRFQGDDRVLKSGTWRACFTTSSSRTAAETISKCGPGPMPPSSAAGDDGAAGRGEAASELGADSRGGAGDEDGAVGDVH
jgi:hypothetical protein